MIISEKELAAALVDYDKRNKLIRSLTHCNTTLEEQVLAFWLGSSLTKLDHLEPTIRKSVDAGYFCITFLDRQLSMLDPHSPSYDSLIECRQRIFSYYNRKNSILVTDPQRILNYILSEINLLPDDQPISASVKQRCLLVLHETDSTKQLHLVTGFTDCTYNQLVYLFITQQRYRHLTAKDFVLRNTSPIHKFFLPADDGTILDGLYFTASQPSDSVVIAVIGHFQAESGYLMNFSSSLCTTFGSDVILANHRNYAIKAASSAISAQQLGDDIAVFARHFAKTGKRICFYGMCGGVPHVTLATKKLGELGIGYKVIFDRFAQNYLQTQYLPNTYRYWRLTSWERADGSSKQISSIAGLGLLVSFAIICNGILRVSHYDTDCTDQIRKIPENNLLILEAKASKHSMRTETDEFVHPDYSLRNVIKDICQRRKSLLKKLIQDSESISASSSALQPIFQKMSLFFRLFLQQIHDEKLVSKLSINEKIVTLHSDPFILLKTRSNKCVSKLITGFFSHKHQNDPNPLIELSSYKPELLREKLQTRYPLAATGLSCKIAGVCAALVEHHLYFHRMRQRVLISHPEEGDFYEAIRALLASDLNPTQGVGGNNFMTRK